MRLTLLLLLVGAGLSGGAIAREPIPDKLVVLTFDDASKSHVTVAAPLLKKHGFGATFFVTEGFDFPTNKRDYMTWDDIASLHRDGFEIGNHTRDHKPPSSKEPMGTIEQIEAINAQCLAHGIPRPVSFAYPGNVLDLDVLPILAGLGIQFARRGGSPEYPYEKGQGFAYEPGLDHPLLIPSAGDARPGWTLDDFKRAVSQAKGGKIAVIQLHGVPDTAHAWVNTPAPLFESYLNYLADNDFKVVALRDLARYVDPKVVPSNPKGVIEDRKALLSSGRDGSNARPVKSDDDLRNWLVSMLVHHRYRHAEAGAALGLNADEVAAAAKRLDVTTDSPKAPPRVLPYPGGRHPRIGFLDGAIRPQRETKVSLFTPWADGGYAVADVPEAVWHNTSSAGRKLLYLAHTHIPTTWDEKGLSLAPLEWIRHADGLLQSSRTLPNGVVLTSRVSPASEGVRMEFRVTNGSDEALTGLDVQMCVMLKGLSGFERTSKAKDDEVFEPPFAAACDASRRRWVITGWEGCKRTWGNNLCPCIHSDPRIPDCQPGESKAVRGWTSFYDGPDIHAELKRLKGIAFGDR